MPQKKANNNPQPLRESCRPGSSQHTAKPDSSTKPNPNFIPPASVHKENK